MSKRKDRKQAGELFESVSQLAGGGQPGLPQTGQAEMFAAGHADAPIADEVLANSKELAPVLTLALPGLRKMKKFRFQLLHQWMLAHLQPGRVADVGGGKGLLTYLLRQSGWPATVIDPVPQTLPAKFKDLTSNRQIHLATETVPRLNQNFEPALAGDFDILVALHAHGCNIQLIEAAAQYSRRFVILPCCIIHEPIYPPLGVHWLQCVVDYATRAGFKVQPFRLNFKGQNIGLYGIPL